MTIQQIEYILQIADCGTICDAAQKLHISQPHLSQSLKSVETEFGIQIFNRSKNGVTLTSDGKEFFNFIKPIWNQQRKLYEYYSNKSDKNTIDLKVSSQRFGFVVTAVNKLCKSVPSDNWNLSILQHNVYDAINDVSEHRSDFGIISFLKKNENIYKKFLVARGLDFHKLLSRKVHVHFRADHPLANKKFLTLNDLSPYPLAIFSAVDSILPDASDEIYAFHFQSDAGLCCFTDRASMKEFLADSDAFCFTFGIFPEKIYTSSLTTKLVSDIESDITLGWIHREDEVVEEQYLELIKIIKEIAEE